MSSSPSLRQQLSGVPVSHPSGLTPHTALVAALLYMMSIDGDLAPEEISRLQESVGKDKEAIPSARAYLKKNKFDSFLKDANEILDRPSKLCILANVYETMLSDGVVEKAETTLFKKLQKSFGFTDKTFEAVSSVILAKNEHAVLGPYHAEQAEKFVLTPHLILAASILYMMSADGEVSNEEIGQLSAVINPYEGLQSAAMAYVEKIQLSEFIQDAKKKINEAQKTYVLLNLCDSMLADGVAEPREIAIFNQILEAFGFSEHAFKPNYSIIHTKNVKPFESKDSSLINDSKDLFQNIINGDKGGFKVTNSGSASAHDKQMHERVIEDDADGEKIRRTMDENTKNVKDGFGSNEHLSVVTDNALSAPKKDIHHQAQTELNILKAQNDETKENVQKVAGGAGLENLQNISTEAVIENTQKISLDKDTSNIQSINDARGQENVQSLLSGAFKDQNQKIEIDGSSSNIQSIDSDTQSENKAKLKFSTLSDNVVEIPSQAEGTNIQSIESAESSLNNQTIDSSASPTNVQTLNTDGVINNQQKLETDLAQSNKAKILADQFQINVQAIEKTSGSGNTLTIDPSKDSSNKAKISATLNLDNKANQLKDQFKDKDLGEKNHVLASLVKDTENASLNERLKHLGSQLENVNSKLNKIESVDRSLPIPMQSMVNRLAEQLNQEDLQNKAKIKDSSEGSNKAPLLTQAYKDDEPLEEAQAFEDLSSQEPSSQPSTGGFAQASNEIEEEFKDEFKNDFKDEFKDDFKDEFKDEFKDLFNDDFQDDIKVDAEDSVQNQLKNVFALEPAASSHAAFDSLPMVSSDTSDHLENQLAAFQTRQSTSGLKANDTSLLFLQLKKSKSHKAARTQTPRAFLGTDFLYKSIKLSTVFILALSWHVFNDASCDMVSCSWSQIGSPVRLDLEPEVIPTDTLQLLKLAGVKTATQQV
jgi:uncharacterized tellurite resistance protein B-like protein